MGVLFRQNKAHTNAATRLAFRSEQFLPDGSKSDMNSEFICELCRAVFSNIGFTTNEQTTKRAITSQYAKKTDYDARSVLPRATNQGKTPGREWHTTIDCLKIYCYYQGTKC
jgi:hypothetical protein